VPFARVEEWRVTLAPEDWQTIEVRDGEKGPLVTQVAWTLVQAKSEGKVADVAESLLVFREEQGDGSLKHDYLLSNEIATNPPVAMAWVHKAEHRIEECLKQAKGAAGLADYQVRTWEGWHHHQCLSLLASWFLCEEARGEKIQTRALTVPVLRVLIAGLINRVLKAHPPPGCSAPPTVASNATRRLASTTGVNATAYLPYALTNAPERHSKNRRIRTTAQGTR
jgi:hypothetical protein